MRKLVSCTASLPILLALAAAAQTNPPRFISNISTALGINSHVTTVYDFAGGDIDGDGKPDLVMSVMGEDQTSNPPFLKWFKGNGDGTFTEKTIPNALTNLPQSVLLADLNADGILDLVTSTGGGNAAGSELDVYIGNGDGTFKNPQRYLQNVAVLTPVVADLKGTGQPDIAVSSGPNIQIMNNVGDGSGTFVLGQSFAPVSPNRFNSVLGAGKFSNNSHVDLLVQDSKGIRVLNGNGTGTVTLGADFTLPSPLSLSNDPIKIADVNGDGHPDVIVALSDRAEILLGNGNGAFQGTSSLQKPLMYPVKNYGIVDHYSVVEGDFNHDGHADFVVGPYAYLGKGDGTFSISKFYSVAGAVEIGLDVNSDGNPDLVWADVTANYGSSLNVALGSASGIFHAPQQSVASDNGAQDQPIVTGDFNHDGIMDVATGCGQGKLCVFAGSGAGYLKAPVTYTVPIIFGLATGDVNGDGKLDLVVTNEVNSSDYQITVLLGKGDGTFEAPTTDTFDANAMGSDAKLIDMNGDGKLDLVGEWGVALGNGNGTFQTAIALPSDLTFIEDIVTGDFNNDGIPDLAMLASEATNNENTRSIHILLGDGHGNFLTDIKYSDPNLFSGLAVADVNNDGNQDLLYSSLAYSADYTSDTTSLAVAIGNGHGAFAAPAYYNFNPFYCCQNGANVIAADFDGDGITDAIVTTYDRIEYFKGLAGGMFAAPQEVVTVQNAPSEPSNANQFVVLDVNKDGYPDLAVTDGFFGITRLMNTAAH